MGLFDSLTDEQSQAVDPTTGLNGAQMRQMQFNTLGSVGAKLLAAGQNLMPAQRAQILGEIGDAATAPQSMMMQMQQRLLQNNMLSRQNAQQANLTKVMSSPDFQAQFSGMTPQMQALAKAAAASGDINGVMGLVEKSQPKVSTDGTVFDPQSKTITNIYTGQRYNLDGTPVAPANGAAAGSAAPNNGALTGDEYLKSLPEGGFKNTVQGIVNGDIPPPPLTARNGYSQEVIRGVTQADPSFSFNDAGARKVFVQDNAKGQRNQQALTLGTFANHLNSVADAASKLPNGELPAFNAATNEFLNQTGDPRVKQFNTEIHALQGEAGKMFRAGVVTDQEMRELSSNISAANSPEQMRGVLDSFRTLVQGRVNSLDSRGQQVMGKAWNPDKYSVITPDTRKQLDQYDSNSWGRPQTPANAIDQATLEAEARRRGLIK